MQRWSSPAISQIVSTYAESTKQNGSNITLSNSVRMQNRQQRAVVACFLKLCLSRSTDTTKTSSSTMSGHPRRRKLNEKNERFL